MSSISNGSGVKIHARIDRIAKDLASYEFHLVIVGTSVWAGNMSSSVRTYAARNKNKFKNVTFFCTYGGSGSDKTLKSMELLCGKRPVGVLDVFNDV